MHADERTYEYINTKVNARFSLYGKIFLQPCFKCFYDDALTELVNHYANRTLIVSCTRNCTHALSVSMMMH